MPDPNDNPNDNPNNNEEELVLDDVVEVAPDDLSDEQKTFLEENKADLSDEQAEKFGLEKEEEPEDVEPETRTKSTEKPKDEKPEEEEEDVDPDDKATISKVVDEKLDQVTKDVRDTKDQIEVDAYIRDNPEYAKYRPLALKYMKNPAYNNIPARNIIAIVAGADQQKIGAKKEREATAKVKETQGGGTSARKPKAGEIDWGTATPKEIAAKKAEIIEKSRDA